MASEIDFGIGSAGAGDWHSVPKDRRTSGNMVIVHEAPVVPLSTLGPEQSKRATRHEPLLTHHHDAQLASPSTLYTHSATGLKGQHELHASLPKMTQSHSLDNPTLPSAYGVPPPQLAAPPLHSHTPRPIIEDSFSETATASPPKTPLTPTSPAEMASIAEAAAVALRRRTRSAPKGAELDLDEISRIEQHRRSASDGVPTMARDVEPLAESLAALREAESWEWPLPPSPGQRIAPLQMPRRRAPQKQEVLNDAEEDDWVDDAVTPVAIASRYSDRRDSESASSVEAPMRGSSAMSSEMGPLTPDDVSDDPFDPATRPQLPQHPMFSKRMTGALPPRPPPRRSYGVPF
ncbi:hypothetical protein Q8F55_007058 [Vanrija albida]|uniref:Uncharacterized protein n=1 Tax=Vanrija albida TaxID=181172 RepID=A0ABR3PYQ4_9TREE